MVPVFKQKYIIQSIKMQEWGTPLGLGKGLKPGREDGWMDGWGKRSWWPRESLLGRQQFSH